MTDTSEAGLEKIEGAIRCVDELVPGSRGGSTGIITSLIAALRTARADLQEARGLLERARGWIDEPEYTEHAAESARRFRQGEIVGEIRLFLRRTEEREG